MEVMGGNDIEPRGINDGTVWLIRYVAAEVFDPL